MSLTPQVRFDNARVAAVFMFARCAAMVFDEKKLYSAEEGREKFSSPTRSYKTKKTHLQSQADRQPSILLPAWYAPPYWIVYVWITRHPRSTQ